MSNKQNVSEVSEIPAVANGNITPRQLADELGIDAKTLRRVMRSMTDKDSQPGSGGRWEIDAIAADAIRARVARNHNRKTVTFSAVIPAKD